MKVVLVLSDRPSECSLTVDGILVEDAQEIHASVTMEEGSKVSYVTAPRHGIENEIHDVEFTPVIR